MSKDKDFELVQSVKVQLQAMIDLNPDCMMMLDGDRCVTRANRAFVDLVGRNSFGEVLSTPVYRLFGLDDISPLAPIFSAEKDYSTCRVDVRLKGDKRTLEFCRVGGDENNQTVFVIVKDISNRLLEDIAVEKQHKQAAVQQLVGAMMHHLNQPLTVIMLRAQILTASLKSGNYTENQILDALNEISKMAITLAKLLRNFESNREFSVENYTHGLDIMKIDGD